MGGAVGLRVQVVEEVEAEREQFCYICAVSLPNAAALNEHEQEPAHVAHVKTQVLLQNPS